MIRANYKKEIAFFVMFKTQNKNGNGGKEVNPLTIMLMGRVIYIKQLAPVKAKVRFTFLMSARTNPTCFVLVYQMLFEYRRNYK